MKFEQSMTRGVPSDNEINNHYKNLLSKYLDTMDSAGSDVEEIRHEAPKSNGGTYTSPMHSSLMTFTKLLEAMDDVVNNMDAPAIDPEDELPLEDDNTPPTGDVNEDEILDELDKLFTPVLVMQGFEQDIADQTNAEMAESGILTERNIISFDDETRMSQLISVCAKLLAKKKNTPSWQMFQKASTIKKQSAINIQKEEYEQAKTLAQKYLVKVSTSSNSSVARDAANDLLPQTNH